jgi:hypothetical protein
MTPTSPLDCGSKAKISIKGREYASPAEMPPKIRDAYARAVGETALLRSGARLAARLDAKIIFNGIEYNGPGEMPVAERRMYQDALAALLPEATVLSTNDAAKIRGRKLLLTLFLISALAVVVHLWFQGFFNSITFH